MSDEIRIILTRDEVTLLQRELDIAAGTLSQRLAAYLPGSSGPRIDEERERYRRLVALAKQLREVLSAE